MSKKRDYRYKVTIKMTEKTMSDYMLYRVKTNADSLIGRKGIVTEEVSNVYATGQVTVAGQEWTARSVDDSVTLEKGEMVVIRSISGVKLMVERIAE